MRPPHSSLYPLLIFCILGAAISQDTTQDTNTESYAFNYLNYLNRAFFKGSWHSTSTTNSKPFNSFEENDGFFMSDVSTNCKILASGLALGLTVFDGRYVNGDFLKVSLCQTFSPSFHFDSENASFIGSNVALNVSGKGLSNKVCSSDVSIHFLDRTTNTPMKALKYRDNRKIDIVIQFIMSSQECAFSLTTDILTQDLSYDSDQELFYTLVYSALLFCESAYLIIKWIREGTGNTEFPQISILSLSWRLTWGVFLFMFNLGFALVGGSSVFAIPILVGLIQVMIIMIFAQTNYQASKAQFERSQALIFIMMPCFAVIWCVAMYYDIAWLYLSSSLYLVPQIYEIYRSGERRKFNLILALLFLPSQLFFMGYIWANPNNFARQKPYPLLFFLYLGLVIIQVIILILQGKEWKSRYETQNNEMRNIEQPVE